MVRLSILTLCLLLFACNTNKINEDEIAGKRQYLAEKNEVSVIVVKNETFKRELVANGKLSAIRKSILRFDVSEELSYLPLKNGDFVKKGSLIARLNQENLFRTVEQAKNNLAKSKLELQDILIGQGYEMNDSIAIPEDILEVAKVRSGYSASLMELNKAKHNLRKTSLIAPFPGVVANIENKIYEQVSAGKDFCTLIDNSVFEVKFSVLETEISDIKKGKRISVSPFSMNSKIFHGTINEINPVIDEHGMIEVKASIKGSLDLIDGMNVKVYIETKIPDQLVVPRQAVVIRDNQEVLFKYTDSIAWWTYVNVLHENSSSYAVIAHPDKSASLEAGDTVIISGNMNLAHESAVVVK